MITSKFAFSNRSFMVILTSFRLISSSIRAIADRDLHMQCGELD